MNPIAKNIFAVIAGWLVGSVVNMGLVMVGHSLFPISGVDPNDMEAMAAAMPTLSTEHFIFPFLAHALGTLVGALFAAWIAAANRSMQMAMIIGVLFLIGGIAVNMMLPGPTWFTVADILVAYLPMAWIGGTIGVKLSGKGK